MAGSVSCKRDGVVECAAGATVSLARDGATVATATTDCFGDFKIDGLPAGGERYTLTVGLDGRERTVDIQMDKDSVCLGELALD